MHVKKLFLSITLMGSVVSNNLYSLTNPTEPGIFARFVTWWLSTFRDERLLQEEEKKRADLINQRDNIFYQKGWGCPR